MGGQFKPVRGPYLALVGALGIPVTHWEVKLFPVMWVNLKMWKLCNTECLCSM